ncbi:hypothetical protein BDQ17DRAFT_1368282 [Cyathus striatus]|nr:hypothetical protein BDQ17DRAFT_1368282 [Cyathus striatus]
MKLFQTLLFVAFATVTALAATPGISQPAEGSIIQPGATFDFEYLSIGDYGVSAYNYTVWLFTKPPQNVQTMTDWASGYFFGRYAYPSYPNNPNPTNLPPSQLVMPDFSKLGGGFGSGATVSNATFYLVVLEEYLGFEPNVGFNMSLVSNAIRYNVTA